MIEDKRAYFEECTRSLLKQLDNMKMDKMSRLRAKSFTRAIRDAMTLRYVQVKTFKIPPRQCSLCYDAVGFCRVSSLTFLSLMSTHGELTQDWDLYVVSNEQIGEHHFLKHKRDNTIFDLSFDQFTVDDIIVPYDAGVRTFVSMLKFKDPVQDFYKAAGFNKFKPLELPTLNFNDR